MFKRFQDHIRENLPFLLESKLLIAISGGMDSVVLTHFCHRLQLNIALAHCNFKLRGAESDADEHFVVQLGEANQLEVFIEHFNTEQYAKDHKLSVQMAARELRYTWFHELANQLDFDYILTAHHADDNLETFFINLFRGTGLGGLTGIPEISGQIVRPMLSFSIEEITDYASNEKLTWQEDSSNASTKYLRNKLRHDLIPILKDINPQIIEGLRQTQEHLRGSMEIIDDRVEELSNRIIDTISEEDLYLNISEVLKLSDPKAYLHALLKDFGFTEWNDVTDLLQAQSGKQVFSSSHRLIKDREHLILTQFESEERFQREIQQHDTEITTPLGNLSFQVSEALMDNSKSIICVDKGQLKFPLLLRPYKKGDYFYPLGMQGKKKLSKYFKDQKWSLLQKERCLLLCSDKDIVWIVGDRADDRFKVINENSEILKIELK